MASYRIHYKIGGAERTHDITFPSDSDDTALKFAKSEYGDACVKVVNRLTGEVLTIAPDLALGEMTRAQLNDVAESLGLTPEDYDNKAQVREAIETATDQSDALNDD